MSFAAPKCQPAQCRWPGLIVTLAAVAALCACVAQSPLPPPIPPKSQDCGAERLSDLHGQHFSALAGVTLPGALRVLYPLQAVTMEFSPTRLNARVDAAGRIRALSCG